MSEEHSIRVTIVDDHRMVRRGLATTRRIKPDLQLVGEASSHLVTYPQKRKRPSKEGQSQYIGAGTTGATPLVTSLMMGSKPCRPISRYRTLTEPVSNEVLLLG